LPTETKELEPIEFNEEYYQQLVEQLKQKYPKIGKRVYKTRRKSRRQVYYEMLDIIKGEPHPKRKTRIVSNK
jgi:hypothetical protein